MKEQDAWAYFLTFRTYATFLHGDSRLSIDPKHNIVGTPKMKSNIHLHQVMKKQCAESEFSLNAAQRVTVLQSMLDTCQYFSWIVIAAHVRSNHVHIILQSDISKEMTMRKLKAYATQLLRKKHEELLQRRKFWAEHGSTKLIWAPELLLPAMYYVIEDQGESMALFYDEKLYDSLDPALYKAFIQNM